MNFMMSDLAAGFFIYFIYLFFLSVARLWNGMQWNKPQHVHAGID